MRLFRRRPNVGIGIDLGTASIKVVELARGKRGLSLTTYAVARQPNLLLDGTAPDSVARAAVLLRAMFQRARVSHGDIVTALPILSVFSTVLDVPQMPERELSSAVTFMAKNYVPSPLNEVVLAWSPIASPEGAESSETLERAPRTSEWPASLAIGTSEVPLPSPGTTGGTGKQGGHAPSPDDASASGRAPNLASRRAHALDTRKTLEVFLTAAPRDLVGRYAELFERLGRHLSTLEVESFPLARSLIREDRRPVLLVDLGEQTTSFSVVERGYLRLNQAIDIGGEAFTNAIMNKLSLSWEQAEQRKRAEGLGSSVRAGTASDAGSPVAAVLRPLVMDVITRAEVVRRLYERKQGHALVAVQLIGGGAWMPQLASFWTSVTGLPCEVGNPWRGISAPPPLVDHLRRLGPSLAVAVGLALRPFEKV